MSKNIWLAIALVMILPVTLLTTSCTKHAVQTKPISTTEPEIQKAPDRSAEQAEQLKEDQLRAEASARKAAETAFVNEKIHFAFDSSELSGQARNILNGKAAYLQKNQDITVTVEGHCDDRGTDAYNIALGQRRAESVKNFLADLGITANRLNTISYGEKRPIAMDQNETSWAQNRRVQFVLN